MTRERKNGAPSQWARTKGEIGNGERRAAVLAKDPSRRESPAPMGQEPDGAVAPFISIAIPTYNRAGLLLECVQSALAQNYPAFEVLVSDNASTDATADVLRQIGDARLRVVRQEKNIGLVGNWNACLAEARGAYVTFLSDDDRLAPHFLERCASVVKRNRDIPITIALSSLRIGESVFVPLPNAALETGVWLGHRILGEFLRHRLQAYICTFLFQTDQLRAQGGFPAAFPHTCDLAAALPLLLPGSAGLVNESCGIHAAQETSDTAKLSFSFRLTDDDRLAQLIIARIEQCRLTARERKELIFEVKRFVARNAVGIFAEMRARDVETGTVIGTMWRWRKHLRSLRPEDFILLYRQFATIVLPRRTAMFVARLKKGMARALSKQPGSSLAFSKASLQEGFDPERDKRR